MPAAHTHSNIEINYLQSGQMAYLHGGVQRTVGTGRLALFWAGVPHQSLAPANGTGIWLMIPLVWVLQWKLPRDLAGRLLAGEFFDFAYPAEPPLEWLEAFDSGDPQRRALLVLELHVALGKLALSLSPAVQPPPHAAPPLHGGGDEYISRVTAFIAIHYSDASLTVDAIASTVKLHPNYLMTLFKSRCNMSLWEYVTRLRVSHAQRLLVTTEMRVLDVAMESGFGSLMPFYNAFARYSGVRPLAFRRQQ